MPPPARTALAALTALAGLAALAGCGNDAPSAGEARAEDARQAAEDAGLPDGVADLLADAAAAVDRTYRVAYDVDGGRVVVTQRPPDRRVDVVAADGTVDSTISVGGRVHACTDPAGDEPWRCERLADAPAEGGFDADAVADLAHALSVGVDHYDFAVEEEQLLGTSARCLVTRLRAGGDADPALGSEGRLCIADTGALLLVERPAGIVRATQYATGVDDDAFDLPVTAG